MWLGHNLKTWKFTYIVLLCLQKILDLTDLVSWFWLGQGQPSAEAGRGQSQDSQSESAKGTVDTDVTSRWYMSGESRWNLSEWSWPVVQRAAAGSEGLHRASLILYTISLVCLLLLFPLSLCRSVKLSFSESTGFYTFLLLIFFPISPRARWAASESLPGAQLLLGPEPRHLVSNFWWCFLLTWFRPVHQNSLQYSTWMLSLPALSDLTQFGFFAPCTPRERATQPPTRPGREIPALLLQRFFPVRSAQSEFVKSVELALVLSVGDLSSDSAETFSHQIQASHLRQFLHQQGRKRNSCWCPLTVFIPQVSRKQRKLRDLGGTDPIFFHFREEVEIAQPLHWLTPHQRHVKRERLLSRTQSSTPTRLSTFQLYISQHRNRRTIIAQWPRKL